MPAKSLSKMVNEQRTSNQEQENEVNFDLSLDEIKFILAKLAQIDFKGVEIEFTYNLIVKLQEHFKYLSKKG